MSRACLLITGVFVFISIGEAVGDCVLPPHPTHGRHVPDTSDCGGANKHPACDGTPGTTAPESWLLYVRCNPGYQLAQPSTSEVPSVCTDGSWSIQQLPTCILPDVLNDEERCIVPEAPPHSIPRLLAEECGAEDKTPGSPVPHDCIMELECETGYHRSNSIIEEFFHCINKTWNPPIPKNLCIRGDDPNRGTMTTNKTPTPGSPPVLSDTGCVLPYSSPVRKYCPLNKDCAKCNNTSWECHLRPGSKVDQVRVVCDHGYALKSSDVVVCLDGDEWTPSIPECYKLCPPLRKEALTLELKCQYNNEEVPCSKLSQPGTKARFRCRSGYSEIEEYKRQNYYNKTITCNEEGDWSEYFPQCILNCGASNLKVSDHTPTIIDGLPANIGFFPWNAGLYSKINDDGRVFWNQTCGGSLISDRIVLTAAHCVDKIQDFRTIRVAVGKYYRSWDVKEENEEKREVLDIAYPREFNRLLEFDIALVVLKTKITFGEFVMPVCLETDEETYQVENSKPYYVVGWGRTSSNSLPSENLLYNTVRIGSRKDCEKLLPFNSYYVFDKICAVNSSESVTQKGDSGGGLTTVNKKGRHYIVGIVSFKTLKVALFTKFSSHWSWYSNTIKKFEIKYNF